MKQTQLYDIFSSNPITRQQARDVLGIKGGEGFTWRKLDKVGSNLSKSEFQDKESSPKLARNINDARRNLSGKHLPNYDRQYRKNTITEKDINDDPKWVVDIALYYLEYGNLTDEQRYYLQRVASMVSKQYKYVMFCMIFFAAISLILVIGVRFFDDAIRQKMFEWWLGLGSINWTVMFYSVAVVPIYYIRKLNQVSR